MYSGTLQSVPTNEHAKERAARSCTVASINFSGVQYQIVPDRFRDRASQKRSFAQSPLAIPETAKLFIRCDIRKGGRWRSDCHLYCRDERGTLRFLSGERRVDRPEAVGAGSAPEPQSFGPDSSPLLAAAELRD